MRERLSMTKVMKFSVAVLCLAFLTPSLVIAHDFSELEIDRFSRIGNGPFLEIILNDTVKDRLIVCAIFNASGEVLATDTQLTDNLATKVLINYEGRDVSSVRCVFND